MKRMTEMDRRRALVATTFAALALGWLTGADGGAVEALLGAGPLGFAAMWGCAVCVGSGVLMALNGPSGVILAYVMGAANLGRIAACVTMCAAALTI